MIRSIRYFLLVSLLLSITVAAAINGVGNYLLDEKVIQPYLDGQLTRVSSLIDILFKSTIDNEKARVDITQYLESKHFSSKHFIFQVWDDHNKLLMYSSNPVIASASLKNAPPGFSNQVIQQDDWRILSNYNETLKVKIIVAELSNLRRELADDIAHSNADILLITYPVFGVLVWFIISLALRSVTRVTSEISNRASTYLEPVQLTEIPVEIKPLVAELNQLFIRLKLAFERNKRFSADAAHELRTPLAALKTHAQVALKAKTEEERIDALHRLLEGVDRSSHVVAQLLTLSRLGAEESLTDLKPFDLHRLATEIIALLAPHAFEKNIEIELASPPNHTTILGNNTAVGILIRNVVDNAIRYTPPDGKVTVSILEAAKTVTLRITDTGPGIPIELRERVFERFYRILGSKATGSGLGLAIVLQIAKLHQAQITLDTPSTGSGLEFNIIFPKYSP